VRDLELALESSRARRARCHDARGGRRQRAALTPRGPARRRPRRVLRRRARRARARA
jgi:hypothetical protein